MALHFGGSEERVHAGDLDDGLILVDRPDGFADCGGHGGRDPLSTEVEGLGAVGPDPLGHRYVEGLFASDRERGLFDVAQDSDDGGPGAGGVAGVGADAHEMTDGVSMGKLEIGKGLVDEDGGWCSGDVVVIEEAAADERDAYHGFDVAGGDGVAECGSLLGGGFALELHAVNVAVSAERELGAEAGGDDSGELADAVECVGEDADAGGVGVEAASRGLDLHGEDVGGVEAGVDGEEMLHAAKQQTGTDEEDGGEGDFRGDQSAAGHWRVPAAMGAPSTLPGVEVFARGLKGGNERPEDDSDDCGGGQGEEEGRRVDGQCNGLVASREG